MHRLNSGVIIATATYTSTTILDGFNSGTGEFTSLSGELATARTIDEDFTFMDADETLSIDDAIIFNNGMFDLVYTGFTLGGFPVAEAFISGTSDSEAFIVLHNGEISNSGVGGTAIAVAEFTLCFMQGTLIETVAGKIAVEELKIGDELLVDSDAGQTEPVKFVFKRDYQHPFINKQETYPICIKKEALGENSPSRDLYVSPEHAVLVDGVFTQANALVNGSSIYKVESMPSVFTYYHIELANHQLILAENVFAETYIDNVARETFDNYNDYEALYGQAQDMTELEYPRAKSSRQLPKAFKQKLAMRAEQLYPESALKIA